jgi:hypothetical protein
MGKSNSSRSNSIIKRIKQTSEKALPIVDNGLKKVGTTTKTVAKASIPIVEKGVSNVFGVMSTGFDLGVKGAKAVAKGVTKKRHSRRHRKGGRKSRRNRKH